MNPIRVHYTRGAKEKLQVADGMRVWQMVEVTVQSIENLRQAIDTNAVDDVVLIGSRVAAGWRIYVDRPVEFVTQAPEKAGQQLIAEIAQASDRIVRRGAQ